MLRAALVTVAAVASALVAASLVVAARTDTPPFSECAVTNTISSGGVTQLVSTKAWVSTRFIGSPVTLKKGDSVCTNASGQLWWRLNASSSKTITCNTSHGGSLRVFPPSYPGQAVRFRRGVSTCSVNGSGSIQFAVEGSTLLIRFADPIFVVDTDPEKGTMVKFVQGFAEVTGQGGGRSVVVVGPGQQSFVPVHGNPESPTAMHLAPAELAAATRLKRSAAQPSFSRPAAGRSPVLRAIYDRRTIRVAIDGTGLSEQTAEFVKEYFDFLAESWKVRLDLTTSPAADALKAVAARELDVFVTPTDVSDAPGVVASPLVSGSDDDDVAQLVLPEDAAYATAMASWLQQRLFFGRYGDLYRSAYQGAEAPYDPLRQVLP